MYTSIGAEDLWKKFLDGTRNVINTLNTLPKLFGKIPIGAISMIADMVKVVKDIGFAALGGVGKILDVVFPPDLLVKKGAEAGQGFLDAIHKSVADSSEQLKDTGK